MGVSIVSCDTKHVPILDKEEMKMPVLYFI